MARLLLSACRLAKYVLIEYNLDGYSDVSDSDKGDPNRIALDVTNGDAVENIFIDTRPSAAPSLSARPSTSPSVEPSSSIQPSVSAETQENPTISAFPSAVPSEGPTGSSSPSVAEGDVGRRPTVSAFPSALPSQGPTGSSSPSVAEGDVAGRPTVSAFPSSVPSQEPTGSSMPSAKCLTTAEIEVDDFEFGLEGWNTKRGGQSFDLRTESTSSTLTKYMGAISNTDSAEKLFINIPSDADSVSFRFDVYKLNTWTNLDTVMISIDGNSTITLGNLNEASFGSMNNISWSRSPIGSSLVDLDGIAGPDQVHHVSMMLPKSIFSDTSFSVKFFGDTNGKDVIFGIDNIEIVAHYLCSCTPTKIVDQYDFEDYAVDVNGAKAKAAGWWNGRIDNSTLFSKFLGRYASEDSG
jgi:hypothetical protein